jgi:ATP-dependent Clp protease ATP-binding subunit ClpA
MFNKFAMAARAAVLTAAREAQTRTAHAVTDEHLLLALVASRGTRSARLLASAGITSALVDEAFRSAERKGGLSDAEAESLLRELGIDVDQVVSAVEESLGEGVLAEKRPPRQGRVPFAGTAKTILRGALDEAKCQNHKELTDEHLLLALAAHDGVAGQLLSTHGLSYLDIRTRLAARS